MNRLGPLLTTVCLAVLVSCLQTDLVPCGTQLCAAGQVCASDDRCARADQIVACEGLVDGAPCGETGTSACDRGVCVPSGCGNGALELTEACDGELGVDTTLGERCSDDCQRVWVCGNGVVDPGETCDDSEFAPGTGLEANPNNGCNACAITEWRAVATIGGNVNALAIGLASPQGIALDRQGNVYIADTQSHRIFRLDTSGVVTLVAGTGTSGFSGDGGAAQNARLNQPIGIAIDGLGNVYFVDRGNARIRRVATTGIITTIAGSGIVGYGGDGGLATAAQFNAPWRLAVDGLGNVFIADRYNNRVRRVDSAGVITTFAGTGVSGLLGDGAAATSARFNGPTSVSVDGQGNVYVCDSNNHRIRRIDTNGIITTVVGSTYGFEGDGGPAISAKLASPDDVHVDVHGNLYVTELGNRRIRRVDASGIITTIAGTGVAGFGGDGGPATSAEMIATGTAVDSSGDVYVADTGNHRIRRIDTTGIIMTVAGTGAFGFASNGGAATSARLEAQGVALDTAGNVYVADSTSRVWRISPSGVLTTIAGSGVYGFSGDGDLAIDAQLSAPYDVAIDAVGNIYIADSDNHRIRRVDPSGIITTFAGTGVAGSLGDGGPAVNAELGTPVGLGLDAAGNLYIADQGEHRVRRVDSSGMISTIAGTGSEGFGGDGDVAVNAQLRYPSGVAVDSAGDIYIADTANYRVRRIGADGVIQTIAGGGLLLPTGVAAIDAYLELPYRVAVDGASNVFVADQYGHAVLRVDNTSGDITTLAGEFANSGFSGDGGPAIGSLVTYPTDVAVTSQGVLYIADSGNGAVRRIDTEGVITTIAGPIDPDGMGPLMQARLADPRALALGGTAIVIAGGSTGTVQLVRESPAVVEVAAGRYPQSPAVGDLARFRGDAFGDVEGIAFDVSAGKIYLTESSANRVLVVTIVDFNDVTSWTIAPLANAAGTAGFADGAALTATFRKPTGLFLDGDELYVADTGNHVVRVIDLVTSQVRTIAGTAATRGFFGDDGPATAALLFEPKAVTRCSNGDVFIADTGNHRVRRITASTGMISTVLGDGVAASSGAGSPARAFPVDTPRGLACDPYGNLAVTSTTTVRMVMADASGVVDGAGPVQTVYGVTVANTFPARVTRCLTGLALVDASTFAVTDACSGLVVTLHRE